MSTIQAVADLLREPKNIVIFSHRNPDGDAVGSSLGLRHFLEADGHRVTVILPSPYPRFLDYLPGVDEILIFDDNPEPCQAAIGAAELFFVLDFNDFDRIDKVAAGLEKDSRPRVLIDHHLYPSETVAQYQFSRPEKSSTCEMIYDFVAELGRESELTRTSGDCLYTGIITDTGGFKYSTSPGLFRTVAKLLELGVDDYRIQDHIWNNQTEKQLRLLGHVLANQMEIIPELRTGILWLTKADYEFFDIQRGDTEGVVNYVLRMPDMMIAAFIHEQPTITKISLRSKGEMDVQQICKAHFRGGGHRNAAGGASFSPLGTTINKFKRVLPDYAAEIEAAYHEFNQH